MSKFTHEPPDALTRALHLPLRALESKSVSTFGANFARVLAFLWSTLLPLQVRLWLIRRFQTFLALRSQARFRLKTNENIRFFDMDIADREVVTIDGIKLKTTHLWPRINGENSADHSSPHPVCIMRTVYSRKFDIPIARILAERGYHVLLQDTRGHFDSEGEISMGELESRDSGCTLRWLSEQEWCDGRVFLIGISIGGYTTWASVAGMLRRTHLNEPITTVEEVESPRKRKQRKQMQIVAAFPFFSSSDILRSGTFVDLDEGREDVILRLDLASRYSAFMWDLARPKKILGSHTIWVFLTVLIWQIRTHGNTFRRRQMHLPLQDIDIAVCEDIPNPRLPFFTNPKHEFWSHVNYEHAPFELGRGDAVGDDPTFPAPALFFASGWFDIFREQTMSDYLKAMEGAASSLDKGNRVIYLLMGPWSHFSAETFFGPLMRETLRVLDHVFADLGRESHLEDPLTSVARVTSFCFGAGGFFFHRLPSYKKLALLMDPNNPFNVENDSNHCWRYYDSWPPRTSAKVVFRLQPRGKLEFQKHQEPDEEDTNDKMYDTFLWDPLNPTPTLGGATFNAFSAGPHDNRPLEARPDTLVYTSPPNQSRDALEIAGEIKLKIWLYSTAVSADVCCRISLVDPMTHESISLCDGIKRITLKSEEECWPRLFDVNLGNFCASVEPKWRLRITVAGGSFPQYSRNLGYGDPSATATRSTKARHRVSFQENGVFSSLELPLIGGQQEALRAFCGDGY